MALPPRFQKHFRGGAQRLFPGPEGQGFQDALNNACLDVEWHRQMAELDAPLLKGTLSMIFGLQPDKTSQIIDVPQLKTI
jgi:hypothetical protein